MCADTQQKTAVSDQLLMKKIQASFISGGNTGQDFSASAKLLDGRETHSIDNLLWSNNGYMPEARFCMAHTANGILLKYTVKEKHIKAVYRQVNDPVYKDSCVELFIAFDNESNYYNLEFNSLGTALVGFGSGKNNRTFVNIRLIEGIQRDCRIKTARDNNGLIEWELVLHIPFTVFEHHHITSLSGRECLVNFYKCGDDLPDPHFLSWSNIIYPQPNFHLPEFFGSVEFIS